MLKTFSGRRPSQDEAELHAFTTLLQQRRVRRYLEIGAREGDTFCHVMRHLPEKAKGVAVDLPGGLWGKSSTARELDKAVRYVRATGREAYRIMGDSRSCQTIEAVMQCGPYDAVLIDGDHTYEGVLADWINYGSLAPLVAFHDIVGQGQAERVHGRAVEVPRLWAEIKAQPGTLTREFIAPGSHMGIGCVIR